LRRLLSRYGFSERIRGDHHIFTRENIFEIINLQPLKDGRAKPYQVKWVRNIFPKELPGCMANGRDYKEAVRNALVVIREWIETAREVGREIPEPKGRLIYA